MATENRECEVCRTSKDCKYCDVCDAWICDKCRGNWVKRFFAAVRKIYYSIKYR